MAYPQTIDTFPGTAAQGTSLLTSPDHSSDHRVLGSAAGSIEQVLGTTPGTSVLRQIAGASDYAVAANTQGTLRQTLSGGTLNNMNLGTPTIGSIIVPGTIAPLSIGAAFVEGYGTLTDNPGGTLTVNAQGANIYYSVLGTTAGTRTIGSPLNPTPDQRLSYGFKTSANANGTLSWGTIFRFSQTTTNPTLQGVSSWNYFDWRWNSIDARWDFLGQTNSIADALGTVQFDASAILGQIAGTSLSVNFTCTGANGILFAQVLGEVVGTSYVSGASYNGVTMTQLGSVRIPSDRWMHVFYLLNPTQGANTLTVTGTASGFMEVVATSYKGVSGLDGTVSGTNGGSVTVGTIVTTKAADWAVAFIGAQAGQLTAGTTGFLRQYYNDTWHAWFDSNAALALGTVTITANNTGTTNQAVLMAALSHA